MRKRGFVPEIWHDRKTLRWSHELLLFFLAMFSAADDRGRGHFDPVEIAAKVCRWRSHQVEKLLAELTEAGVLEVYGGAKDDPHPAYFHLINFNRHQYISKMQDSAIPLGPSEQPKLPMNALNFPNGDA